MNQNSSHIVIFDQEHRVLLIKRSPNDDWGANLWALPGGTRKGNETLIQNIIREVKEETGLAIIPNKIRFLPEISKKLNHIFFMTDHFSGEISLDDESSSYKWTKIEEIDAKNSVPGLKNEIFAAKMVLEQPKIIVKL